MTIWGEPPDPMEALRRNPAYIAGYNARGEEIARHYATIRADEARALERILGPHGLLNLTSHAQEPDRLLKILYYALERKQIEINGLQEENSELSLEIDTLRQTLIDLQDRLDSLLSRSEKDGRKTS